MGFLKSVGAKIVGGLVGLVVIVCAISWYQMTPADRDAVIGGIERLAIWVGVVLVFPWATFAIIGRVNRMDSNVAGATLVGLYTVAEIVLLGWLFDWSVAGATAWTLLVLGVLICAGYNLLTCDWIAEKVG